MYVWFYDRSKQIKLEIGSNVQPEPYTKKEFKSYIHEFLESNNFNDDIVRFNLKSVTLNVLNIERTFIDKIFAVKRHATSGNLKNKVRHIYDVVKLFHLEEIKTFLTNKEELKKIIQLTKKTDFVYFQKRNIVHKYNADEVYNFDAWKSSFDSEIRDIYETLHHTLLYTDEKQDFDEAINVFHEINTLLKEINE